MASQGSDREAGFIADPGSAGYLFTVDCSPGLFPADTAAGMEGGVRGLVHGASLGCFFHLV